MSVNVAAFCREHGISRETFYVWRRRYRAEGLDGLEPRSRAPKTSPQRIGAEVEDAIVALRKELVELGVDAGPAHDPVAPRPSGPSGGAVGGDDLAGAGAARVRRARAPEAAEALVAAVRGHRPQRAVAGRLPSTG